MAPLKVFIIAGEASGDRLGAAMMRGLSVLRDVEFCGVGGAEMQRCGLDSIFPMQELSLMGITEILPKYFHLKRRIKETANAVIGQQPDILITIDSPDFCHRVSKLVRAAMVVPVVHYVAPSVWAWRPKRAHKMAAHVDHVLALLPFEPPLMEAAGMSCDFVGHPVVASPKAGAAELAALRAELGANVMCVLPGSRRGEIRRMGPRFGAALRLLDWDDVSVLVPVAPGMEDEVAQVTADWPIKPRLVTRAEGYSTDALLRVADWALATSGTVSLELAYARTPMVIAYDLSWLSRQIIQRMVKIDTGTLVNLVTDTRTVPEFIGARCRPDLIAQGLRDLRADATQQQAAMAQTMAALGEGGADPGVRAAQSVLAFLERWRS